MNSALHNWLSERVGFTESVDDRPRTVFEHEGVTIGVGQRVDRIALVVEHQIASDGGDVYRTRRPPRKPIDQQSPSARVARKVSDRRARCRRSQQMKCPGFVKAPSWQITTQGPEE